jgi:hypothetical protein
MNQRHESVESTCHPCGIAGFAHARFLHRDERTARREARHQERSRRSLAAQRRRHRNELADRERR